MDSLAQLLRTIVSFRTVGNNVAEKKKCLAWIQETFLSRAGLPLITGDVKGSPYLFLKHPHPKLLWFGHADVVPGSDEQFTLRIDGDKAYGRGVKDMKGADLTFLLAYREACEQGSVPPVSVLFTSDEETGGYGPPSLLDQNILGEFPVAFTPDTGEAEGIVTELKGAVWARLIAEGKGGHAAEPWRSENPISELSGLLQKLQQQFPPGTEHDWQMTVTPTQLRGSDALNRIPDEATCVLDVRFPPTVCKRPAEALKLLSQHIPAGFRLEFIVDADPMYCDPNHPMVQTIRRIVEEVTGQSVPIRRENGSSDARAFTTRGIPAFLYGPKGGDLHGAGEWISLRSLEQHVEMNRRLLKELQ